MKPVLVAVGILALCGSGALAQVPTLPQQAPNMPEAKDVPAEKVAPGEPLGTGSTLSDKLRRSDGVIRPPADATPDMRVPARFLSPARPPSFPRREPPVHATQRRILDSAQP